MNEVMFISRNHISKSFKQKALDLYASGMSAQEVKDILQLPHSVRQIQRWAKDAGISRNIGDAFRNAVKKGRVKFHFNPNKIKRTHLPLKLRYKILQKYNFKCCACGDTNLIEVDHIDENKNNHAEENLQVLCSLCNQGKSLHKRSTT